MAWPWVGRRMAEAEQALAYQRGVQEGMKLGGAAIEREGRWREQLAESVERERAEVRRLTDIIVELKREGRETAGPVDEYWGDRYTTMDDGDRMRMEEMRKLEEQGRDSHDQLPTTDGGAHTEYAMMAEMERAAEKALNAELPSEVIG